jgi:hypothetical protein
MNVINHIIFFLISLSTYAQNLNNQIDMYVISENGLNVRAEPNIKSNKVGVLRLGSKVKVEKNINSEELINGKRGKWVKIYFEEIEGYIFDSYISKICPIDFQEISEGCWKNDILRDWANKIGKIDSIEYDSYGEGEKTYKMNLYNLNNECKYIEHYFWECDQNEIQITNLNSEEMKQFINSILKFCKNNEQKIDKKIEEKIEENSEYYKFAINEDCCIYKLEIKIIKSTLIITIQLHDNS